MASYGSTTFKYRLAQLTQHLCLAVFDCLFIVLLYACAFSSLVGLCFCLCYSVRRRSGNVTAAKPTRVSFSLPLFNPVWQVKPAVSSADHAFPRSWFTGFALFSEQRMIFLPKQRWTVGVRNEETWHRVKVQGNSLHTIKRGKANRIGYILHRNCLLKQFVDGKVGGRIEWMGR